MESLSDTHQSTPYNGRVLLATAHDEGFRGRVDAAQPLISIIKCHCELHSLYLLFTFYYGSTPLPFHVFEVSELYSTLATLSSRHSSDSRAQRISKP